MVEVVITIDFEVCIKNFEVPKIRDLLQYMQCCQLAMAEILAKVSRLSIYFLSSVPTLPFVLMFFGAVAD
jgi:hypothetical protein